MSRMDYASVYLGLARRQHGTRLCRNEEAANPQVEPLR